MKKSLFLLIAVILFTQSFVPLHANDTERTNHYTQVIVYFAMESLTDIDKSMSGQVYLNAQMKDLMERTDTTMNLHQIAFGPYPLSDDPARDSILNAEGSTGKRTLAYRAWFGMNQSLQDSENPVAKKVQDIKNQTGANVVTIVILANNQYYVSYSEFDHMGNTTPVMVHSMIDKSTYLNLQNKIIFDEMSTKAEAYFGEFPQSHPLYTTYTHYSTLLNAFGYVLQIYPRKGLYKDQHGFWLQVGDDDHNVLHPTQGWKLDYLYNRGDLDLSYGTTPDTLTIKQGLERNIELYPGWNDENTGKVLYTGGEIFPASPKFTNEYHCRFYQTDGIRYPETILGAYAVAINGMDDAFAMDYILVQFVPEITYPSIDASTVPASVKTGDIFTISLKGDVDLMTSWRPEFEISGVGYEVVSSDNKSVTIKALSAGQMTVTLHHRSLLVLPDETVSVSVKSDVQKPLAPETLAVSSVSEGQQLTWNTVSNADSYTVYRRLEGEQYDQALVSDLDSPLYVDGSELPNGDYYYVVTAVNSAGESSHSNEVKVSVTSVVEDYLVLGTSITTYPNPVVEQLNVRFSLQDYTTVSVSVRNMTGQEMDMKDANGTDILVSFSVSEYPIGVYFLTITLNGETTVRKFVKEDKK